MKNKPFYISFLQKLLVALFLSRVAIASGQSTQDRIGALVKRGVCGPVLQNILKMRANGIMAWNRPYAGDGVKDCYGFCRQVWNAILLDGSAHSEDFTNYSYGRAKYWEGLIGGIPVNTFPDSNWASINSLGGVSNLVCGDIVGTTPGHRWGMDVHYGIAAGKCMDWDCHGGLGAEFRSFYSGFSYYYRPLHVALTTPSVASTNSTSSDWHYQAARVERPPPNQGKANRKAP